MFTCRSAWQRCGPLARQSLYRAHLSRDVVPRRLMSSVPGGSGQNIFYVALCTGTLAGALAYSYRTVATDRDRFADRISEIEARPKSEWKPKPWPPKKVTEAEEEESTDTAAEEPVAEVLMETAQASRKDAGSRETFVEKVAETVAETAEVVAEVAGVVAEAAEEVTKVAEEVEKVAEEVEAAAEAVVAPVIEGEESASESNVAQSETVKMAAASVFEMVPVESVSVEEVGAAVQTETASDNPTADDLESEPVPELASVDTPVTPEEAPVAEEVSVALVTEEAPVTPMIEEVSIAENVLTATPVSPVASDEAPVDSPVASEETPVSPVADEAPVDSPVTLAESPVVEVTESVDETVVKSEVSAEASAPTETSTAPDSLEDPVSAESKKDYVVVVLDGAPKTEKKPKVFGISPVTGKIIPAPDDDVETSGQVIGQAPIA